MPKKLQDKSTHMFNLYENDGYIELIWKGPATAKEYKKVLDGITKYIEKFQIKNLLLDSVKLGVIPAESQDYIAQVALPNWIRIGVKNFAVIMPESASSKLSTELASEKTDDISTAAHTKTEYFINKSDATEWLKKNK